MSSHRRDRSRSPMRSDAAFRRKDNQSSAQENMMQSMNPMMMANMYQQGNMMMSSMYPNMMMGNNMMTGNMMPSTGMEMMAQPSLDMSAMTPQAIQGTNTSLDMNMMGGMMMDPSMIQNTQIMPTWNIAANVGAEMPMLQEKKEITFKHCVLTPPTDSTPLPPRRPKPPGCRTIFIGGLPDKIRESIIRDIFERYGRIHTLRLSKKNFCHIRFDREESVDAAMMISGYQIKVLPRDKDKDKEKDKDSEDSLRATTGWLHVDYALSRDDQSEFERKQRQALRLQQQQMEVVTQEEHHVQWRRSPSPIRITPFSITAVNHVAEKIKTEEQFQSILPTLVAWLERGECSKKNANQFYSMLQATNSHIRRLFNEKMQAEDELQETREKVKNRIESVIQQLEQVAKVFSAATHQRVWDHFTKAQRKNIETWHKMTQEFSTLKDDFNEKFFAGEENMDYGNGYNNAVSDTPPSEELQQLKRENESLQFQLEAYKNEVDVIKMDAQKEMEKFKAQFIARQVLQGAGVGDKLPPLPSPVSKPPPPPPLPEDLDNAVRLRDAVEAGSGEAKLIGVMGAFLHVHPTGASLDYIVSYVRALFPHTTQATVHHVLQKHPDVFCLTTHGIGANIENKWTFIAFKETKDEQKSEM